MNYLVDVDESDDFHVGRWTCLGGLARARSLPRIWNLDKVKKLMAAKTPKSWRLRSSSGRLADQHFVLGVN